MATEERAHIVIVGGQKGGARPRSVLSVSLPHPRSNEHVAFLLVDGTPHELHKSAEGSEGSWLLAHSDSAQEDGSLLVASPIDPTFFVLARLFAARAERAAVCAGSTGRRSLSGHSDKPLYEPLSDLLTLMDCPGLGAIAHAPDIGARLAAACHVNTKYDEPLVRIDERRALGWLRAKVAQIQRRRPPLLARGQPSGHAVCAGTLDESAAPAPFAAAAPGEASAPLGEASAREAREAAIAARPEVGALGALGLLSDYLNDELLGLVAASYGLSVAQVRAEAAEPAAPAPRPLAPRAQPQLAAGDGAAGGAGGSAMDAEIAEAEAEAAAVPAASCRPAAGGAPGAGAPRAPGGGHGGAQPGPMPGGPAAKKARLAPAIAKLAKTDVRRMQPLTSFFGKKPS